MRFFCHSLFITQTINTVTAFLEVRFAGRRQPNPPTLRGEAAKGSVWGGEAPHEHARGAGAGAAPLPTAKQAILHYQLSK